MSELKERIYDEQTGLDYVLAGDCYIPAIELPKDDDRPIGKWGRMHKAYLEETNPLLFNHLILTGKLHTYLADLDEQAPGPLPAHYPADGGDRGRDQGPETALSMGLDTSHEQYCRSCRGNHQGRDDQHLTGSKPLQMQR